MVYLSNGPCKLAPLRPEIHIFSRTHWFSIRQVIGEKLPMGSFDFCTFQTQLYFIPARMMCKITGSSEGDQRAWRGNGAENSSQEKEREDSPDRRRGRTVPVSAVSVTLGLVGPRSLSLPYFLLDPFPSSPRPLCPKTKGQILTRLAAHEWYFSVLPHRCVPSLCSGLGCRVSATEMKMYHTWFLPESCSQSDTATMSRTWKWKMRRFVFYPWLCHC